jgi:putative membrane protein
MMIARNWAAILIIVAIEIFALELHELLPDLASNAFSEAGVAVLAGAVGVFLSFRFNEAYGRWWEARILWGGIVNASRTFARQVATYVTDEAVAEASRGPGLPETRRELVHRQIAWVNALRLSLREQAVFPEIDAFLGPDEARSLRDAINVPAQLMLRQSERTRALFASDAASEIILARFDSTLTELTALQGGAERIKRTAFPDRVVFTSRVFVWVVALLVAIAFIDPVEAIYILEFIVVMAIVLSFKIVAELGEELSDPFENTANDTPMTALCRTIEIDLRQMLGEADLPAPIEPENGVLM